MYDATSRYTLVTRLQQERLAEARRDHLLRTVRDASDEFDVRASVTDASGGIRRAVGSALTAIRQGFAHDAHARVPGAAVR